MIRLRPAIWVLVISAIALVTAVAVIAMAGSGSSVASVGARPAVSEPGSPTSDTDGASAPQESPKSSDANRLDATVLPRTAEGQLPVSVRIGSLDVQAPVGSVGLDSLGRVDVPLDVDQTGWYRYSVLPGADAGSTVIVGHKDGVDQGPGAFFGLGDAQIDDIVTVTSANGSKLRYRVVARESFDKNVVPLDELFATTGAHRLTLITCGGPFDATTLGYTDNVVVTAVPVETDALVTR